MQFATFVATAITLALGANAVAIARSGARLAQFRIFGAEGCRDINDGFYLVDTSDVDNCNLLEADPQVVSVNLEVLYTTVPGACTVSIYTDTECTANQKNTTVNVCNNSPVPEVWKSWKVTCKS